MERREVVVLENRFAARPVDPFTVQHAALFDWIVRARVHDRTHVVLEELPLLRVRAVLDRILRARQVDLQVVRIVFPRLRVQRRHEPALVNPVARPLRVGRGHVLLHIIDAGLASDLLRHRIEEHRAVHRRELFDEDVRCLVATDALPQHLSERSRDEDDARPATETVRHLDVGVLLLVVFLLRELKPLPFRPLGQDHRLQLLPDAALHRLVLHADQHDRQRVEVPPQVADQLVAASDVRLARVALAVGQAVFRGGVVELRLRRAHERPVLHLVPRVLLLLVAAVRQSPQLGEGVLVDADLPHVGRTGLVLSGCGPCFAGRPLPAAPRCIAISACVPASVRSNPLPIRSAISLKDFCQ